MINSPDPRKTMLLHSEAKIEFYKKYLERYLRILYRADWIRDINIFDVFCGTGFYDNKKKGSPIVAFDAIRQVREEVEKSKNISLVVNDGNEEKVSVVKEYIERENKNYCSVAYYNQPAEDMFQRVVSALEKQSINDRNLIFIDPYGYKEIKKETLELLLRNGRTEIMLFLPIAQMQRFTTKALTSDLKPYEPLKNFIHSFFDADHPIRKGNTIKPIEYIEFIKNSLRFNDYYTASYYIERDKSNYYALFFIGSKIYGLEKILEVKWQLADEDGSGFKQPKPISLFDDQEKEIIKQENYQRLESILKESLKSPKNNREIYEIILANEFLPKHAKTVFKTWQNDELNFIVTEIASGKPANKGKFYCDWKHYKEIKTTLELKSL